jgi:hypothetical protein
MTNKELYFLSKHKEWITLTPDSNNRRKPLEALNEVNKYSYFKYKSSENSKMVPAWMQRDKPLNIPKNELKKEYIYSTRGNIKLTILAEINRPPTGSIFTEQSKQNRVNQNIK